MNINRKSIKRKGHLFILSAPSGAGKTTLSKALLKKHDEMIYSISFTTRPPRKGEQDGIDYFFISEDRFKEGIAKKKWIEWALVHGNYYGTSADFISEKLNEGKDILLEIDVQGAVKIKDYYPDSISVFIMPPSFETLRKRLESRGLDNTDIIDNRLENAKKEMAQKDLYDHIVINDDLTRAMEDLFSIIERYR